MNVNLLTLNDKLFPKRLISLDSCPKQLYVLGNTQLLNDRNILAVVGSRKATSYGKTVTTQLIEEVSSKGIVIVSGLALGIDAIAHKACLNSNGKTIAVLPCGLDAIYPASHRNLAIQILEREGLLVSEYPSGTPALRQHFIARNRIVSGLSDAVLITEASEKSGTIHTANFALNQGKTVMAVMGNITSSQSQGTNNLIRVGAQPVTSANDIYFGMDIEVKEDEVEIFANSHEEETILKLLKDGYCDGDEILKLSKLDITLFNQTMSMLEITKRIRANGSNQWCLY